MNNSTQKLYTQFDQGINWNAFLYIIQKSLTTILTFALFYKLSPTDFSVWANVNSIIFLVLLWLDFGFRKSIPKYIPEFSKDIRSHLLFTKFIIAFQLSLLCIFFLIFTFYHKSILGIASLTLSSSVLYLALVIFVLEAFIALLKLIYHAHFWNREFNLFYSIIITAESVICGLLLFYINNSFYLLVSIMFIKVISGIITNIVAISGLRQLYLNKQYQDINQVNYKLLKTEFVKHSAIMWGNTTLKSLTERNFIFPILTLTIGVELANVFKIANDWALLFQRSIVKTIGTTDTLLFSQINELNNESVMNEAFQKICSKIRRLCIPLFGILIILLFLKNYFINKNELIFKIFILLVISYLIESILSPYERVLEVKRRLARF